MSIIAYYRVSTQMQGRSGLGLDAQRESVLRHLNGEAPTHEFVEVESGSVSSRPELAKALALTKRLKGQLVVATMSRLARDTRFMLSLADSGARISFADMPSLRLDGNAAADRFLITVLSGVNELERNLARERTRAALAAKKARGGVLGNAASLRSVNSQRAAAAEARAEELLPRVEALLARGLSKRAIAAKLGVPPMLVWRTLARQQERTAEAASAMAAA